MTTVHTPPFPAISPTGTLPSAGVRAIMGTVMEPSIDDRDWYAARLAAGDTIAQIGQAAGVSRQTASAWLKRHGLQANNVGTHQRPSVEQMTADYQRAGSIRTLAAEYGISSAAMRTWLFEAGIERTGEGGRPTTDVDVDDVKARRERGDSWRTIANDLGIPHTTLKRKIDSA